MNRDYLFKAPIPLPRVIHVPANPEHHNQVVLLENPLSVASRQPSPQVRSMDRGNMQRFPDPGVTLIFDPQFLVMGWKPLGECAHSDTLPLVAHQGLSLNLPESVSGVSPDPQVPYPFSLQKIDE